MKIGGTHFDQRSAVRAGVSRRVENASGSSRLSDDVSRQAVPQARFFERRRSRRSSRFDTRAAYEAEQNGTPSAFVAQILGQILDTGHPNPVAVARVYARASRGQAETHIVSIL
jgi:hypothetical protein